MWFSWPEKTPEERARALAYHSERARAGAAANAAARRAKTRCASCSDTVAGAGVFELGGTYCPMHAVEAEFGLHPSETARGRAANARRNPAPSGGPRRP